MAERLADEKAVGLRVPETVHNEYSDQDVTDQERRSEKALIRKLDCFIAPVMMLLMLISYLDRGNIGFAATQGMSADIRLKGSELNTAVSVFYIFYILAEFPTSILVKQLQFNRVIPTITFCWGIREELAVRIAFLFIASALSGAFGGLLAWAMLGMNGVANMPGWRWLYIIEGIITVAWAACCVFLVPRDSETAYFLNAEEKLLMRKRAEEMASYSGGSGHYGKKDIMEAAKDIKSWVHGVIQIAVVTILYGFGTFLPIIIRQGFRYSLVQAQYLVIPVNLWGALVYAVGAVRSDKYNKRFLPMIICAPFGIAGYAILLCEVSPAVQYFATYLIATACFLWQIYQTNAAPKFTLGHAWSLGCLAFAWLGWWVVRWIYLRRQAGKDQATIEGVGVIPEKYTDRSPEFRYQI
ncbi:uncharacterized protein J7T55_009639 [Diaporthe amygdali]|uniref:uncharacterized protein n=1 Tax=Phomopsis amygdali TaxID=1214568 RepID=UPI0022FED6E2|nr:uncharacterized protein J7T55_009639 [Diaporthe amygdali]KAJ0109307.1 uncharacterized protein J7T55_009639 [Diaporthe amygdali]